MTSAERKIIKRAKKKVKRLQAKLESLKLEGKDGSELESSINRETKNLKSIKSRFKLTDDQDNNSSDNDELSNKAKSFASIENVRRHPEIQLDPASVQHRFLNYDFFNA